MVTFINYMQPDTYLTHEYLIHMESDGKYILPIIVEWRGFGTYQPIRHMYTCRSRDELLKAPIQRLSHPGMYIGPTTYIPAYQCRVYTPLNPPPSSTSRNTSPTRYKLPATQMGPAPARVTAR